MMLEEYQAHAVHMYMHRLAQTNSPVPLAVFFRPLSSAYIASTSSLLSVTWLAFWNRAPYRR